MPPGNYDVIVNKSGFSQAKAQAIEVRVTETTRVTISLKPGAVSETVQISAQVTSVETTNAQGGLIAARDGLIQARVNAAVARVNVRRALGVLDQTP